MLNYSFHMAGAQNGVWQSLVTAKLGVVGVFLGHDTVHMDSERV